MASSCQFIGKDRIMTVYDNKKLLYWSLWQGTQFLEKGQGREALSEFLDMLSEDGSLAIYTLKLYDRGENALGSISNKSEFDGSYNFKLSGAQYSSGGSGQFADMLHRERRIWELEQEIRDMRRDAESKQPNLIGSVMDAVNDPQKLGQYINIIRGLLSPRMEPSGAVGRIPVPIAQAEPIQQASTTENDTPMEDEKKLERLAAAIDILEANDPKIIEHLEKLAKMSKENKSLFSMVLMQLDSMK